MRERSGVDAGIALIGARQPLEKRKSGQGGQGGHPLDQIGLVEKQDGAMKGISANTRNRRRSVHSSHSFHRRSRLFRRAGGFTALSALSAVSLFSRGCLAILSQLS